MAQKRFRPQSEAELPAWFTKLGAGIGKYGAILGLTPAEIADAQANCAFGAAVLGVQGDISLFAQGFTRFKNAALWATEPCTAWPVGYTMPAGLPPVSHAGILPLLMMLIGRMKKHYSYTKQMGEEMGIEGADEVMTPEELAAMKPHLKIVTETGGHPLVKWIKGKTDGIELLVDRGDGKGFVFLAVDTTPDYLDTFELPASGASAVWKYKAIYRLNDARIGQWSDEVQFTVKGA